MLRRFFLILSLQSDEGDPSPHAVDVLEDIADVFDKQIYSKINGASSFYGYATQINNYMQSSIQLMKTQQLVNELPIQELLRNINSLLVANVQEEEKNFLRRTLYIVGQWNYYIHIVLTKNMSFNLNTATTEAEWQYNQGARSVKNGLIGGIVGTILGVILPTILLQLVGILVLDFLEKIPILSPVIPFLTEHKTILFVTYLLSILGGAYGIAILGAKFGEWLGNKCSPPRPMSRPFAGDSYRLESNIPSAGMEQKSDIRPVSPSNAINSQQPVTPPNHEVLALTLQETQDEAEYSLTNSTVRLPRNTVESLNRYDLLYKNSLFQRTPMAPIQIFDTHALARRVFQ